MKAIRLTAWERPAQLVDVPCPEPGPGEVLVRVAGAGLCHSDLHLMHWRAGTLPYELPFTLGHEVAGTVAALGRGPTASSPASRSSSTGRGDAAAALPAASGPSISASDRGRRAVPGSAATAGWRSTWSCPPPRLTVPLDGLDPVAAAPLADAGLTPYHAIRRALDVLRPGTSAIVIGVGGLGHVAVQLLKALSPARVVAVDRRDEALEVATRSGADVALQAAGLGRA